MLGIFLSSAGGIIDALNPLSHLSSGEYVGFWSLMFSTLLSGFWARLIAAGSLALAFWLGVYRRRFGLAFILFFIAVSVAYLGGLFNLMFWWAR